MGKDYGFIAVNSTANKPEADIRTISVKFLEEHKVDIPVLIDYSGDVGRMYGARTTPDMRVIDGEGKIGRAHV